jgi:hypothetical protein
MNEINWGSDLDDILWIPDIDKEEWFYVEKKIIDNEINKFNLSVDNIISSYTDDNLNFYETVKVFESEINIKINYWNKNWWYIELLTINNDLIWKIWADRYIIDKNLIDSNHLWIEVYWEFQWNKFSKILYLLYRKFANENDDIFFPEIDFAMKTSRISLLLNQWYVVTEKYVWWSFIPVTESDIEQINQDIKNNYYWNQSITYKFELLNID